jgi:GDP/UDP-N,N'-diacetylbacillosamine 2-epimerase (hydrolysing)
MMRIGILTSSRADFGIYLPLITKLAADKSFDVKIIAFGTHLSAFHGYTLNDIKAAGFSVDYTIESLLVTDSPSSIATAMGVTIIKFADFWKEHTEFDLIFSLGDRYEMFAAVIAGVPFQIPFAHLHGGETTLGAIDNTFRHGITLASKYHFVSTEIYAKRVEQIIGDNKNIFYVGALSLDNLFDLKPLSTDEFKQKWSIDLSKKTILTTFHPETINYQANEYYTNELVTVIDNLPDFQVLITMPNADTAGNMIRQILIDKYSNSDRVKLVENLGSAGYFTAMKYCEFLLGNTSSGIIEAASFGKYVINIGDRQKGRLSGDNVIHVPIIAGDILEAINKIKAAKLESNNNIYFNGSASDAIIKILKRINDNE